MTPRYVLRLSNWKGCGPLDHRLRQLLAKRLQAGSHPCFDGAEGQLMPPGKLGLRKAEKIGLFDELPLFTRQLVERARDYSLLLALARPRFRVVTRDERHRGRFERLAAGRCWRADDRWRDFAQVERARQQALQAPRCRSQRASIPARTFPAALRRLRSCRGEF